MTKKDDYFEIIIIVSDTRTWCLVVDYDKVGVKGNYVEILLHLKSIIHVTIHFLTYFEMNVLRRGLLL